MQSDITDAELIFKVKEHNSSDALNVLIDRHSGICHKIYHKYFSGNKTMTAEDVRAEKDSLIYQAATSWNPDFGTKFSTWLGNVVTYACLNACTGKKREIAVDDEVLNHLIDEKTNEFNSLIRKDKELIEYIEQILEQSNDEVAKQVIKMRYLSNTDKPMTFKQIAKHFNVSTQTVVNWHDKFIDLLRKKLLSGANFDTI